MNSDRILRLVEIYIKTWFLSDQVYTVFILARISLPSYNTDFQIGRRKMYSKIVRRRYYRKLLSQFFRRFCCLALIVCLRCTFVIVASFRSDWNSLIHERGTTSSFLSLGQLKNISQVRSGWQLPHLYSDQLSSKVCVVLYG